MLYVSNPEVSLAFSAALNAMAHRNRTESNLVKQVCIQIARESIERIATFAPIGLSAEQAAIFDRAGITFAGVAQ